MSKTTYKDLSWLIFQKQMNEKAFETKVITKNMYEYAKKCLEAEIDLVEQLCYDKTKAGDVYGFIKNS